MNIPAVLSIIIMALALFAVALGVYAIIGVFLVLFA